MSRHNALSVSLPDRYPSPPLDDDLTSRTLIFGVYSFSDDDVGPPPPPPPLVIPFESRVYRILRDDRRLRII